MPDPTKGLDPILSEGVHLTISGQVYRMPRFSWKDMFRFFRTFQDLYRLGYYEESMRTEHGLAPQTSDFAKFLSCLLSGFLNAEDRVYALFASVLERRSPDGTYERVSVQDFDDPKKFPPDSFLQIMSSIGQHPDVQAFFDRGMELRTLLLMTATTLSGQTEEVTPSV